MNGRVREWGTLPTGERAHLFTLENGGIEATVSDYGGTVVSLLAPDREGRLGDVALGYDTLEEYMEQDGCCGATVGRYANRIGGAALALGGQVWPLTANEGGNTLHGGSGFHTKLWRGEWTGDGLRLSRVSPHLEDGFPGTLEVSLTITLHARGRLRMEYHGVCDRDTVCSLTSHVYFNLACGRTVWGHLLSIAADGYTPAGADLLPTGALLPVAGGPCDFGAPRPVSGDYDVNFALRPGAGACALAYEPRSGRTLEVRTTLPGLQLYTSGSLSPRRGKGGAAYGRGSGLCLEPQFFPNAPNLPQFPSPVLRAGEAYRHTIEYRFGSREGA